MLVIKVWCLPKRSQAFLQGLHKKIVKTVVSIKALGFNDETDMTVLFPTDMMLYGLGSEILIEISGFLMPRLNKTQYDGLTYGIGRVLEQKFPKAQIGCVAYEFNKTVSVYWKE